MRLDEDHTHIVHQVDRSIEAYLRDTVTDRYRVNTMALCDLVMIGLLYFEDGPVTCLLCLGKRFP